MRLRAAAHLIALVLAAAAIMATAGAGSTSTARERVAETQELVVFAAASLTEAFEALGSTFEHAHPNLRVRFNFAGSQQLARQIRDGAPADVFASADPWQLHSVRAAIVGEPQLFATNELVIVVERGNPLRLRGLADLARHDLTVVLAAEEVPAGRYARQALERAGVKVTAASLENDVRAVLFKVRLGEADAGIVYASDVRAAGREVAVVPIPPDDNVVPRYPIGVLAGASDPETARAFVAFVQSEPAQSVLRGFGFSPP